MKRIKDFIDRQLDGWAKKKNEAEFFAKYHRNAYHEGYIDGCVDEAKHIEMYINSLEDDNAFEKLVDMAKQYKTLSTEYFEKWDSCANAEMQEIYWRQQEEYENKARGILIAYNILADKDLMYFQI